MSVGTGANTATQPAVSGSGLNVLLHPLPILSISEHKTRCQFEGEKEKKRAIGALLGSQTGREVSIVNSFELVLLPGDSSLSDNAVPTRSGHDDVEMREAGPGPSTESSSQAGNTGLLDVAFLETRRAQYKEVFPTQELVGWYATGDQCRPEDLFIHQQLSQIIENPVFLLLSDPVAAQAVNPSKATSDLPIRIFESVLTNEEAGGADRPTLEQVEYTVETGEAERIAVDGAARSSDNAQGAGGDTPFISSLITQRNAIQMLFDRMQSITRYVQAVADGKAEADHTVLRDINALVSSLPTMTESGFQDEFMTEYNDVKLTTYLATLTKSLATLNDLTDKFSIIHGASPEDELVGKGLSSGFSRGGYRGKGRGAGSRPRGGFGRSNSGATVPTGRS